MTQFVMQHNYFQEKIVRLNPRGWAVLGQNICLHDVLCSIRINLICNMTTYSKKKCLTFEPHPEFEDMCKDRICVYTVLYASYT